MTIPFGFANIFGFWVVAITVFILYILVSLEIIAQEIEDPFGDESNDLPLEEMTDNIKRSVYEILNVKEY